MIACNRFCLSNRIDNPTRVTKTPKSLIDVLLLVTRNVMLQLVLYTLD